MLYNNPRDDRVLVDRLWRTRDSMSEHATLARRPRPQNYPKCSIIDVFSRCPVQRETFLPSPVSSVRCRRLEWTRNKARNSSTSRAIDFLCWKRTRDCANCIQDTRPINSKEWKVWERKIKRSQRCRLGCTCMVPRGREWRSRGFAHGCGKKASDRDEITTRARARTSGTGIRDVSKVSIGRSVHHAKSILFGRYPIIMAFPNSIDADQLNSPPLSALYRRKTVIFRKRQRLAEPGWIGLDFNVATRLLRRKRSIASVTTNMRWFKTFRAWLLLSMECPFFRIGCEWKNAG